MELDFIIQFLDWLINNYPTAGSWVIFVIFVLAGLSIIATACIKAFNLTPKSWITKAITFILELFSWAQTKQNKEAIKEAKANAKSIEDTGDVIN